MHALGHCLYALQPFPLIGANGRYGGAGGIPLAGALVIGAFLKAPVAKIIDRNRGPAIQYQFGNQAADDRAQPESMPAESGGKHEAGNFLGKT